MMMMVGDDDVRYGLQMTLGDQDWFTVLGYELPHLFYHLPCRFNMQTSVQVGEQLGICISHTNHLKKLYQR